ncbi:MAG: hypothetical protein ACK47B_12405 [Armatimonadota bacterium]
MSEHLRLDPTLVEWLRESPEALSRSKRGSAVDLRPLLARRPAEVERRQQTMLDLRLSGQIDDLEFTVGREELTLQRMTSQQDLAAFELPLIDTREVVTGSSAPVINLRRYCGMVQTSKFAGC